MQVSLATRQSQDRCLTEIQYHDHCAGVIHNLHKIGHLQEVRSGAQMIGRQHPRLRHDFRWACSQPLTGVLQRPQVTAQKEVSPSCGFINAALHCPKAFCSAHVNWTCKSPSVSIRDGTSTHFIEISSRNKSFVLLSGNGNIGAQYLGTAIQNKCFACRAKQWTGVP